MRLLSRILSILIVTNLLSIGFEVASYTDAADFKIVVKPGTKAFSPQQIKIKVGDQVIWVNEGQEDHFLTSAGPSSRLEAVNTENLMIHTLIHPGESYARSFTEAETYHYFCAIHNEMWGTVIVEK